MQKTIGKLKGTVGANVSLAKSTSTIASLRDTDNDPNTPPVRVESERDSKSFSQTYITLQLVIMIKVVILVSSIHTVLF